MVKGIDKGKEFNTAVADAQAELPKQKRSGKGWYAEASDVLQPLVDARNMRFAEYYKLRTAKTKQRVISEVSKRRPKKMTGGRK